MALPHFTPRQLDACVAVAELSSFGLAAKRLHLSASAVSALITELENALGFGVFERTTRKVALTRAGRDFLPAAIAVRRQISLAQSMAVDIRDHAVDIVRVAAPMGLATDPESCHWLTRRNYSLGRLFDRRPHGDIIALRR